MDGSLRRSSRIKEYKSLPPPVGEQQVGPSATSQARGTSSQRRVKRKRDETEATPHEGSLPRTLQSGLLPHGSPSHKSQRTMPMDSSSHEGYYPRGRLPQLEMGGTMTRPPSENPSLDPPNQRGPPPSKHIGELMQNIGSTSAAVSGPHVSMGSLHPSSMLPSIGGGTGGLGGPGKQVERGQVQEIREPPRRKSDDALLTGKIPDQQQQQKAGGLPFGQFGGGVTPQHVIQMNEMVRDRSNHHSRGGSAFQATVDSSGNGHPREHRKRPRPELQLESSKRSPPSDERNIRPPPATLRLPSKGIPTTTMHQFMSPFLESDGAKDSKIEEQFPPGFDYDPNLPMNLQYQLLAYKNEQKRQEKARQLDKPPSKHTMHQSPSSSSQQQLPPQQPPQHHHGEPQRQRSNEHLPIPPHMRYIL